MKASQAALTWVITSERNHLTVRCKAVSINKVTGYTALKRRKRNLEEI